MPIIVRCRRCGEDFAISPLDPLINICKDCREKKQAYEPGIGEEQAGTQAEEIDGAVVVERTVVKW